MEVEPGIVIPADLSDYMILHYFASSFRDEPAVRLARKLIRPGDTVFDIGANIGFWSLVAGRAVGTAGKVFAFEPVPANFQRLQQALELNGMTWVECRPVAVSDREGSTVFYASTTGNSALGSLAQRAGIDSPVEVLTVTLDQTLQAEGLDKIDFLKVDVEGAEGQVFGGGTRTLGAEDAPVIQFEACDSLLQRFGTDTVSLKRALGDLGYRVVRFDGRSLAEVPVNQGHEFDDLFAMKPAHFARAASLGVPVR
jgi:FkbM family methyltransferase